MADLADVTLTLKSILVAAIYPAGTSAPSAILNGAAPVPAKIGRGWPLKNDLMADLAAGTANVSVFPMPGVERNTSRFPRAFVPNGAAVGTITVTVTDTTVTLGGSASTPQNVAVTTNGQAFVYAVQAGDTLAGIASALAALISATTSATSAGPTVIVPGAVQLSASVGSVAAMIRELRRQERHFQIACWCNSPEQRDAVARFVDATLAGAGLDRGREFISLPDGSQGRLLYSRSIEIDRDELSGVFRRDLIWCVEYATTDTTSATEIVSVQATLTPGPDAADAAPPSLTLNL